MEMKIIKSLLLIAALALALPGKLTGSVVGIPEKGLTEDLARCLSSYRSRISAEPVTAWSQIERVNTALYGLNAYLKSGSVTEIYSFVPLEQRARFPFGNLILVQIKPMPWPDAWKMEDHEKPGQYLPHHSHQDIRFLIYEKNGKFIAERWYETEFQAMLAETGLTIPPPTPYYPHPPTPPGEKPAAPSVPAVPTAATQTAPVVAPAVSPPPAPVAPSPAGSSKPLWWIIGTITVLTTIGIIAARRNARPG
jgi:hypothetical protein